MINNTLFILLVILALGEIVLIACFVGLMRKTKDATDLKEYYDFMVKLQQENNTQHKHMIEQYEAIYRQYESINERYDILKHGYELMVDVIDKMAEQHKKLLEVWKQIEERYSDHYEQYKHTHECLKKCMDLMTPIATEIPESIEELRMKLNDAQEIVSRIDDNTRPNSVIVNYQKWNPYDVAPTNQLVKEITVSETDDDDYFKSCTDFFNALAEMATEGETPPDQDAMKEFYETNGFEEIRKKALEEDS